MGEGRSRTELAEPILAVPLEVGGATVGAVGALIQNPQDAAAIAENYANIVLESVVVAPANAVLNVLPSLEQTFFSLGEGLFIIGLTTVSGAFSVLGAGIGGVFEIVVDTADAVGKAFQGDISGAISDVVMSVETNFTDFVNSVTEAQTGIVDAPQAHTPATASATTVAPPAPVDAPALSQLQSDETVDSSAETETVKPSPLTKMEKSLDKAVDVKAVTAGATDKGAAPTSTTSTKPGDSIKKGVTGLSKKLRDATPKSKASSKSKSKESKAKGS